MCLVCSASGNLGFSNLYKRWRIQSSRGCGLSIVWTTPTTRPSISRLWDVFQSVRTLLSHRYPWQLNERITVVTGPIGYILIVWYENLSSIRQIVDFWFGSFKMEHMTHEGHGQAADPHAGMKMSAAHGSHGRHAGHSVAMFRDKFWLSFALTIPVVIWSTDVQHWLGYTAPSFPGSKFIPPILGTVVFVYGGLVFIRGAWGELDDRKPGMMTLISLGITAGFGTSLAGTFALFELDVWWELTSLITIMLLGHWLEMRAISQARGALNALAALLPDTAERVSGADTESVLLSALRVGNIVLVRPGARVPADGTVVEGTADVDESMITGECKTVPKGTGAKVVAGTVASRGSLRVKITAVGDQTALSGIMRLVATAQASGSRAQALANRAAAILFYVAVVAGAITFAYWWFSGDKEHALIRTATVLIIACPHALGLARER